MGNAIRMRYNREPDSECCSCGQKRDMVLDMFDISIGNSIITICDRCNEQLCTKTLRAQCMVQGRTKSGHDMVIIRKRGQEAYEDRQRERIAAGRHTRQKGER